MAQDGFEVDKDGLREALKRLEGAREKAKYLANEAANMEPGELTALDDITGDARELFRERLTGPENSLRSAANEIQRLLDERIQSYTAVLGEYDAAEDNADVGSRSVGRRS